MLLLLLTLIMLTLVLKRPVDTEAEFISDCAFDG